MTHDISLIALALILAGISHLWFVFAVATAFKRIDRQLSDLEAAIHPKTLDDDLDADENLFGRE